MDTTPRTRSTTRHRRAPTPKLSERKKKLFDDNVTSINTKSPFLMSPFQPYVRLERIIIEEADDSDIGPMSPLEFSSSPSSFNEVHRIIVRDQKESTKSRRINFSNVMSELSKAPTNSPTTRSRSGKKTATALGEKTTTITTTASSSSSESVNTKDSSEEDVVGPLCTSMKKLTSMTEPNYEQQMKTPSESNASNKASVELARGASFRKSLIFDTGLTPHDSESNAAPSNSKSADTEPLERPKAKTSLTFGEPVISVRSFYGKPIEKPTESKVETDIIAKLSSHEFAASIARQKNRSKPKTTTKSKSLAKRMKAPSLWRFSGKMKFNRQKRLPRPHKQVKKKKPNASVDNGAKTIGMENVPPIGSEFTSRIEQNLRLQKILKDQTNAFEASRDINWNGGNKSHTDHSPLVLSSSAFLNSDDDDEVDDADADNESVQPSNCSTYEMVEVELEEPTNRKFFKSSATSAKKYRIMGRFSATLKRGGDLKFDPLPKRKKKRPNKDGETVFLRNEISSIIDRLSSPSKNRRNNDISSDSNRDKHSDVTNTVVVSSSENSESTFAKNTDATSVTNADPNVTININSNTDGQFTKTNTEAPVIENHNDFIEEMQTEEMFAMETMAYVNVEKFRQMIPYDTTDPEKISQQESILELLISNGICNDETFQIFIAEPDSHKEKASQILDSLYCVNTMMPNEYENEGAIEWVNSVESMPIAQTPDPVVAIETNSNGPNESNLIESNSIDGTSSMGVGITTTQSPDKATHLTEVPAKEDAPSEKLFPIFSKNFAAKDNKVPTFSALNKAPKEWLPIGDQYQLDIGQKEFGLRTCAQCNMQYSVHEPEDELLHQKYHNCVNILSFKGWNNERVVTQIPDWGLNGRIIYVCETDSKAKKDRTKEVLEMVDRDLGFAARTEIKPKTLVYFAIAKQQIVGVCVVQPLERAHRLKNENGIDCCTTETYPVKCGISRVWIAPQYRRHGIAAKLITSMRSHFIFGAFLSFDDIAFSSPTEDGKKFAAKLTQRSDFLIYEQ